MTHAQTQSSTEYLLWHDNEIFYQQTEKSAAVLLALKSVFQRAGWTDNATAEFLELLDTVVGFDAGAFTHVWQQPIAHVWIRRAYHLAQASISDAPLDPSVVPYCQLIGHDKPRVALEFHLQQFKAIVLGVAAVASADIRFARPLSVELPFALPGTPLSLVGQEAIRLHGLENGCLLVEGSELCDRLRLEHDACFGHCAVDRCTVDRCTVDRCTVDRSAEVTVDDYTVLLSADAFRIKGFADCAPVLKAGNEYQHQHVQLTEDTFRCMQRFAPGSFQQFTKAIVSIAFKPEEHDTYQNISHSEMPGAFFCVPVDNPLALADKFIHELHHNRLFAIEAKHGDFFSVWQQDTSHAPRYYSAWRDDLRPLHGLLHAVYVHVPVLRYWLEVVGTADLSSHDRPFAVCQLLTTAERLRLGTGVLARYAEFTTFGRELFDQLQHDVAQLHREVTQLDLDGDAPALETNEDGSYRPAQADGRELNCREIIWEHVRRFDAEQHTQGMLDSVPSL